MKKILVIFLVLSSGISSANTFPWIRNHQVTRIWFAEDHINIEMKDSSGQPVAGVCGSGYFIVKETFGGYKEFYAGALAALTSGNILNIWVTSCEGDRNIVTGGSIIKS